MWATVVGIGILCVWSTIGGSRSPSNRASLWVIRTRTGGEPCGGPCSWALSLVFSKRTDVMCIRDKVLLCESSGEYSDTQMTVCPIRR